MGGLLEGVTGVGECLIGTRDVEWVDVIGARGGCGEVCVKGEGLRDVRKFL